jgi:hypothetical protein
VNHKLTIQIGNSHSVKILNDSKIDIWKNMYTTPLFANDSIQIILELDVHYRLKIWTFADEIRPASPSPPYPLDHYVVRTSYLHGP